MQRYREFYIGGNYDPDGRLLHQNIRRLADQAGAAMVDMTVPAVAMSLDGANAVSNTGTAVVPNSATHIDVTHGLGATPAIEDIIVIPTNGLGDATSWFLSNIGDTIFRINVNADPGATTATFAWKASHPGTPPTLAQIPGKTGLELRFADEAAAADENRVQFEVPFPRGYRGGSMYYPFVYWVGEDDAAGAVRWEIEYSLARRTEIIEDTDDVTGTSDNIVTDPLVVNRATFGAIAGIDDGLHTRLLCQLRRLSSDGLDTYAGKYAAVLAAGVAFEMDAHGSHSLDHKYPL